MRILLAVIAVCCVCLNGYADELIWENVGGGNLDFSCIRGEFEDGETIYAGCAGEIIKTKDEGKNWERLLLLNGGKRIVNSLAFVSGEKAGLYAATEQGLYYAGKEGKRWEKVFKGKDFLENSCTFVAAVNTNILLGTKAGLFTCVNDSLRWDRVSSELGKACILSIAGIGNDVFVVSSRGLFKSSDGGYSWERVLVKISIKEADADAQEEYEEKEATDETFYLRDVKIDTNNPEIIYLATAKGVLKSTDKGGSWQRVTNFGLLSSDTLNLFIDKGSRAYVVTKSGIFVFEQERWRELSLRLAAQQVRSIWVDRNNQIFAATENGLFKARRVFSNGKQEANIKVYSNFLKAEPSIEGVQAAAIKYAEVETEKINSWRKRADKKAWLPQLSMGVNRNVTDLWHWEGGSTTKSGDDMLMKGKDSVEWDISLSWDLGELIWNDDQTSIDVRSKLMVQLRDDILDEVTKLYFERQRIKLDMDNLAIEDRKKRLESEIKLQEVTAYLDGLTNGYFSQKLKEGHPLNQS